MSRENIILVIADKLGIYPPTQTVIFETDANKQISCQFYWEFIEGECFAYSKFYPIGEMETAKKESYNKLIDRIVQGKITKLPYHTRKHYRWFFQYMVMKHFLKTNPKQVSQQDQFELNYIDSFHQIPPLASVSQNENKEVSIELSIQLKQNIFKFSLHEKDMETSSLHHFKKMKKMHEQLYFHVNKVFCDVNSI